MALYMFFHVLPDSHIEFLQAHPDAFHPYLEGREPEIRKSLLDRILGREVEIDLPGDWPRKELEGFCPEISHRQVKLFHYLLNRTEDRVDHSGCIFQTWFAPRSKSAAIPIDGENFALKSDLVSSLKERIQQISEEELFSRYRQIVDNASIDESDKSFLTGAFKEISSACDQALETRNGLMWTSA